MTLIPLLPEPNYNTWNDNLISRSTSLDDSKTLRNQIKKSESFRWKIGDEILGKNDLFRWKNDAKDRMKQKIINGLFPAAGKLGKICQRVSLRQKCRQVASTSGFLSDAFVSVAGKREVPNIRMSPQPNQRLLCYIPHPAEAHENQEKRKIRQRQFRNHSIK